MSSVCEWQVQIDYIVRILIREDVARISNFYTYEELIEFGQPRLPMVIEH